MDAVEILLLFVVGISVLVFLVIDHFGSSFEKLSKGNPCCTDGIESQIEERISVGDEGEGGEEEVGEDFGREIGDAEDESGDGGRVRCAAELGFSGGDGEGEGEGEGDIGDDWEGIERSELEKTFGEAVVFVSCHGNADKIAEEKMDLYGLQQVALEGPCHGSQPMAFNIPARLKWYLIFKTLYIHLFLNALSVVYLNS